MVITCRWCIYGENLIKFTSFANFHGCMCTHYSLPSFTHGYYTNYGEVGVNPRAADPTRSIALKGFRV
jgi:hypothetical protein